MDDLSTLVAPWRADAARSALLFDFDGTLSPIVDDPADARPLPGVAELLGELAAAYATVGVISGRPVAFLGRHLPASVVRSGLYGLEREVDGDRWVHPDAGRWQPVVAAATEAAETAAGPGGPAEGVRVEAKGLSITLHVRTDPRRLAAAEALAADLARASGLEVRAAKMSLELHPPIAVDKGTALVDLAQGAERVLFAGDDLGDVAAYDALAALGPGVATLAVAVDSPELPDDVRSRATVLLPDQPAVADLLRALLP